MAKKQLTFPTLFSVSDVAGITGRSRETIRRWCRLGRIGYKTLGGQFRFSDTDVAFLLKDHRPVSSKGGRA